MEYQEDISWVELIYTFFIVTMFIALAIGLYLSVSAVMETYHDNGECNQQCIKEMDK